MGLRTRYASTRLKYGRLASSCLLLIFLLLTDGLLLPNSHLLKPSWAIPGIFLSHRSCTVPSQLLVSWKVNEAGLEAVVSYCYSGTIDKINGENVSAMLHASQHLQVETLITLPLRPNPNCELCWSCPRSLVTMPEEWHVRLDYVVRNVRSCTVTLAVL